MTVEVDPRLARRRRQIQEASARRRLRWTISVLLLAVTVGLVVALFQSSWFSVESITVEGDSRAQVLGMLEEVDIEPGISIVSVRAGRAEERLREDPWVAEASVRVVWPRSVEVVVVEHVAVARVSAGDGWIVSSGQGAVLAGAEALVGPLIRIDLGEALLPGAVITDQAVLGALEFVGAIPAELKEDLVVEMDGTELIATVAGHSIELGAPRDMAQKAVTLAVLLEVGLAEGSVISVVSPLRPGVSNPEPLVETSGQVTTETTLSS